MDGEQMMTEMDTYLSENIGKEADAECTLPFETPDEYGTDPIGFGEVTAKLLSKVCAVFDLAVKYNRHSPEYLKSCAQLEKGIKYLGSSCVQKYALEQKKYVFPELEQLNTTNLYVMASVHFRKLDRALTEYMEEKKAVDDALLDMEYRYYNLLERLRSTEVKLHDYNNRRYYGKEDYDPVVHGLAFSEKSWTGDIHKNDRPMAFQRAKAFSASPAAGLQKAAVSGQQTAVSIERPAVSAGSAAEGHAPALPAPASAHLEEEPEMRQEGEPLPQDLPAENVPECIRILEEAAFRSRVQNLDHLGFTEREMRQLTADPLFAQLQPQLAEDIRRALEEHDSG